VSFEKGKNLIFQKEKIENRLIPDGFVHFKISLLS